MRRLLALAALATIGATSPPLVTAPNINVVENAGTASIVLTKAKASSYSKVMLQTVDGTAKAGVDYTPVSRTITLSNSVTRYVVPVTILDNATYQGTRTFTVRLTCTRYCSAQAAPVTVTITDDETPPAPVPTPTPVPTNSWVSAPLRDGGYARCKAVGGCHSIAYPCFAGTTPPNCSYPNIIAQQGDVLMYAWNGCDAANPCRAIGAFWPIGQYKTATPYIGVEGFVDEWEGVVPS